VVTGPQRRGATQSGLGHVVVDGSNIATEGRSAPSLKQLNEAVLAFLNEFPGVTVTVVVDATFGHRIDKKEVAEFQEAIANAELVTPPAGALGRGDGFVLTIADKVSAAILSNDSYQEFHDVYGWLFDAGRLIGGKPVPNVGWVFIERSPVRVKNERPASRRTSSAAKSATGAIARPATRSATGALPRPVPRVPPSRPARSAATASRPTPKTKSSDRAPERTSERPTEKVSDRAGERSSGKVPSAVNSAEKYETFRARHQVGTKVKGLVESYASHGVYVRIGDVAGYLPLRLMTDPAPRTPREHVRTGQALSLAVSGYNDARRSIEVSLMPVDRAVVMKAVTRAGTRNAVKTAPKPVVKQAAKQAAKPATKLPSRVAKAVARAKRAPRRHST
jgi:hypothetical protein